MAEIAIPDGWEVVEPPTAGIPAGWEVVEPEFDVLEGPEALAAARKLGPGAELEYLDAKDGRMEELEFDEWKRREELIKGLDFWDRHVARNAAAAGQAVGGLWDTVKRAAGEIVDLTSGVAAGRVSRSEAGWKLPATAGEAALAGAVDFTDLVENVATTVLDVGIEAAIGGTEEEKDKVDYARYKERFEARRTRAELARETMLGSVIGGAATVVGAPRAGIAAQQAVQEAVMPGVSELGALLSPTNPLNVVPFGAGRAVARVGSGAARAGSVTAERIARAADALRKVTEIGGLAERAVLKLAPGLSATEAARVGNLVRGGAWTATAAGVTGVGMADEGDLRVLASLYGASRIGLRTVTGVGQFAAAVGRHAAQGPRFQSVLKRVSRDPAVPKWAAQAAKTLDELGVSQAGHLARGAAAGAGVGAGLNVGLTALAGGEETEIAGSAAIGALIGAGFGGLGAAHSKLSGADEAMRINAERMLLAEAHRDMGGDAAAEFFYNLPEEAQLAAGMVQAIAGPTAEVRVMPAAEFEAAGGGKGAGVFIEPRNATDTPRILINGEAVRPAGVTALHEFAHMLAFRRAPGEIKALFDEFATPQEKAQGGEDYVAAYVRGLRSTPEYAGLTDAEAMAKGRAELTRDNPDWQVQEWFAEKGVQALYGQRWKEIAEKGDRADAVKLAELALRAKRAVLENAGVAFNADGSVRDPEMLSAAFKGQGDTALAKVLFGYVKDLADYSPVLDSAVKSQARADAGRGPAINFGRGFERAATHPAFKNTWAKNPKTGLEENEFATKMPDGSIVLKDPKVVAAAEASRDAAIDAMFPANAPKLDPGDALVGRRDGAQGEEISGQVLPAAFEKSTAFTDRQKAMAKELQDAMMRPDGETLEHWYHQIGSGGTSAKWAAAVRAKLGNVRATFREIRPINFVVTKANNLIARVVDVTALKAKMLDEVRAGRLPLWGNNAEAFHRDLQAMFANWSQGLPGETGIGNAKHAALLDFLGKDDTRGSLIKSFRVDRMEDVKPTGRTGWTFDYGKFKRRESPDVEGFAPDRSNTGVIVSAKPGMRTGVIHPQGQTNWRELHEAIAPVWHKSSVRDWLADEFGLERPQVDIGEGSFEGARESFFQISGKGLTPDAAADLAKAGGLAFAQDAAIATYPVPDLGSENVTPGIEVRFTKRLTDQEWDALANVLKGIEDYSGTPDGRAVRLLFFGDKANLSDWHKSLQAAVQKLPFYQKSLDYFSQSDLFTGEDYGHFSKRGSGVGAAGGDRADAGRRSDLLGGAYRHLAEPFAKELARRGFGFDIETYLRRHGLAEAERGLIEKAFEALIRR